MRMRLRFRLRMRVRVRLARVLLLLLGCSVWPVSALRRSELFPYGAPSGDSALPEGDDETSAVLSLSRPLYFYNTAFSNIYVATNGIISTQDLPMEKQYVDDDFPTEFPVMAPFLADLDTSGGRGAVYYRLTESPAVLNRVSAEVQNNFPGSHFTPTHAIISTWENIAAYEEPNRPSETPRPVNTFQAVVAYDETDTYVLFLYPEDGLHFFSTRPKETFNVDIELLARVGFTIGEVAYLFFSRTEGPYYSLTTNEQSLKNLYQTSNTQVPGVWLFHVGNAKGFDNIVPASRWSHTPTAAPRGAGEDLPTTTPEYPEVEYPENGEAFEEEKEYTEDPDFLQPDQDPVHLQPYGGGVTLTSNHQTPPDLLQALPAPRAPLPDPRAPPPDLRPEEVIQPQRPHPEQTLLEKFSVDEDEDLNIDTGVIHYSENRESCSGSQQSCSQNGFCTDYHSGFCCHCRPGFYGNGRHCLPNGAPQRVNGKVSGSVSVGGSVFRLEHVHLHSYVVVGDGRAYTAVSEVGEELGWALMSTVPVGGLFGWLFALQLPNSQNGFNITGAEFTRQVVMTFSPGEQRLIMVQTGAGLDDENHLQVETRLQGSVPYLPPGATVQMEPYTETYNYYPSLIVSNSVREYTVVSAESGAETFSYQLSQNITYKDCRHRPQREAGTLQLNVERVFVMYIKEEQILRYAITNKISQAGAGILEPVQNPCYSGNHDCDTTAQCLPGDGNIFTCQCATGYTGDGRSCYDVDECVEGLSVCGSHSECVNLPGSHTCRCQSGFEFGYDGRTCTDVDECQSHPCHPHASCTNTPGSFTCHCHTGYHGNGLQCHHQTGRPQTECEHHRDSLQSSQAGFPLPGSFLPQCDEEGQYRPLQCHSSTGHCWCVDSRGQERAGTRTPPGTPPTDCDAPGRPQTECEHHRDSLQSSQAGFPLPGSFLPQCDEEGQYRPLQCHSSTGHCWCVDSRGQERAGTRTPPGTPPTDCDAPVVIVPTQRPRTVCENWRESLMDHYGGQPSAQQYLPQCDSAGHFIPVQCYGDSSYCWCVDRDGREVTGTRSHDAVRPACIPTVAPPTMHPLPRPDVTPPPSGVSLLYAQGQQIGVLPLNGTRLDKEKSSVLLALHGSIVVGIDYDCRERKVYWTDLAGRTISRAALEPGAEPEILINTGLVSPEGLAVDRRRRRMFWVDSTPDKIETANLDGSDRRVLFNTDLVNPRAITVDSHSGTLFWTDWNREGPKIESSSVDGHSRKVLVSDGVGLPNALTYDSHTHKLCWADAGTKRLECISPDGSDRRVLHSNLNYPFSMVTFSNHYYFTDWRRDGVIALSRDSSHITDEYLPDQRSHLYGITVASSSCL